MTQNSAFQGSLTVRSDTSGYVVSFEGETDAHDLGHALAAVVAAYIDSVLAQYPNANRETVEDSVMDGLDCGLEHNPEPLPKH